MYTKIHATFKSAGIHALLLGLSIATMSPAQAIGGGIDEYQQNILFNPSQSMLTAEATGRVTIYDGMEDSQVERAMDEQFERIDNMMFVRTRTTNEDGSITYSDDGCD